MLAYKPPAQTSATLHTLTCIERGFRRALAHAPGVSVYEALECVLIASSINPSMYVRARVCAAALSSVCGCICVHICAYIYGPVRTTVASIQQQFDAPLGLVGAVYIYAPVFVWVLSGWVNGWHISQAPNIVSNKRQICIRIKRDMNKDIARANGSRFASKCPPPRILYDGDVDG